MPTVLSQHTAQDSLPLMTRDWKPEGPLVVATDGSVRSDGALRAAREIAGGAGLPR
jgi:hypothetical protein